MILVSSLRSLHSILSSNNNTIMLFFRHARAAAAVGHCARQFSTSFVARFPPVLAARAALTLPTTTIRTQTRLNSSVAADAAPETPAPDAKSTTDDPIPNLEIPGILSPPWQITDLHPVERKAFEVHGVNYIDHLNPAQKLNALRAAKRRQALAKDAEKTVGSLWYLAMQQWNRRRDAKYASEAVQWEAEKVEIRALATLPKGLTKEEMETRQQLASKRSRDLKQRIREFREAVEGKNRHSNPEEYFPMLKEIIEEREQKQKL